MKAHDLPVVEWYGMGEAAELEKIASKQPSAPKPLEAAILAPSNWGLGPMLITDNLGPVSRPVDPLSTEAAKLPNGEPLCRPALAALSWIDLIVCLHFRLSAQRPIPGPDYGLLSFISFLPFAVSYL